MGCAATNGAYAYTDNGSSSFGSEGARPEYPTQPSLTDRFSFLIEARDSMQRYLSVRLWAENVEKTEEKTPRMSLSALFDKRPNTNCPDNPAQSLPCRRSSDLDLHASSSLRAAILAATKARSRWGHSPWAAPRGFHADLSTGRSCDARILTTSGAGRGACRETKSHQFSRHCRARASGLLTTAQRYSLYGACRNAASLFSGHH